jgi:hypothetical protein
MSSSESKDNLKKNPAALNSSILAHERPIQMFAGRAKKVPKGGQNRAATAATSLHQKATSGRAYRPVFGGFGRDSGT